MQQPPPPHSTINQAGNLRPTFPFQTNSQHYQAMSGVKRKPLMARQNSLNSLHVNPIVDPAHSRSCSEGNSSHNKTAPLGNHFSRETMATTTTATNTQDGPSAETTTTSQSGNAEKENVTPNVAEPKSEKLFPDRKSYLKDRVFKPTSLQFCMQNDVTFRSAEPDPPVDSKTPNSGNVWVHSDSEAAPASSWSTLPNRSLLRRPLPVDIGRCKCMIVKETTPQGFRRGSIYSLYTYEGHGRQNRKLAMAYHRRRRGRSEFVVAKNLKGLMCDSDDGFIGSVKANFMGSRYYIRDQVSSTNNTLEQSLELIQGILLFKSTLATWTGSYRSMKAWIPKHKRNLDTKNGTNQVVQLPRGCKGNMDNVYQAVSRAPRYNSMSKQYELDFRDRGQGGLRIQSSVKNLQLCMEEKQQEGKQRQTTILQLGRISKTMYLMDFRYPLTGYQAFCICLASIDSKLCCAM